jgi:hypothetical protein
MSYLRVKNSSASHHIGLHARLRAQHPRHVIGMSAGQCSCSLIPMFSNPASACHFNFS